MNKIYINLVRGLPQKLILSAQKPNLENIQTLKYVPDSVSIFKKSYTNITGLRSMQHIKGAEREIIEAYRNELPHEIWGDAEKLKEWAIEKFRVIAEKDYKSFMLDDIIVAKDRNEAVKEWARIIDENYYCKQNPFLKLKIIKSITENLAENNMQIAPSINLNVFEEAVHETNKTGKAFKKVYYRLLREFDSVLNVKTEEVAENGVRGKWFSVKVPNWAEAERQPGLFNKIKEFVSVLSQGSNWCTRVPRAVGREFSGCDFHIFIDRNGVPQLCLAGTDSSGGWFRYVRGNDQYAPIQQKYKQILKSFLERNNLDDAIVGRSETNSIHILDICE